MLHTLNISADHPALPGHFPGNPIVPGVVILQQVIEAAVREGYRVSGIANAKFTAPLRPDERCEIVFEAKGERLHFTLRRGQQQLLQGSLEVEPAPA